MEKIERKNHIIDAEGKILGRLATEVAVLLRGKNKPNFVLYKDMGDIVTIKNVEKLKFTGKKLTNGKKGKIYYRHTGYMGGLKETPLKELFAKKPSEVLRKAVMGMLTKNKLRARQIKRLRFEK